MILLAALIIVVLYAFSIGAFIVGFDKVPLFFKDDAVPKTKFSVIIPFRNEAENLPNLIKSIAHLNYPKNLFECIFVDDESTDSSVKKINEALKDTAIPFQIIKNRRASSSPKKDAITSAINLAKNEWIITTDADCILPKLWLTTFDAYIQRNEVSFIAGPVNYYNTNSFLMRFQAIEFRSLIGTTIGSFGIKKPFLCNGANLAYQKDFFNNNNGFSGNNDIASGDDIFLLEKALKTQAQKVSFLKSKNAIVLTKPESNLRSLISQRVRWAAKTSNYKHWFGKSIGLIVLLMNALLVCTFTGSIVQLFPLNVFGYLFAIKMTIDFLLLFKTGRFLNTKQGLGSYVLSSIMYPFFNVFVAFTSLFSSYKWKGRRFNK